MTDRLHIRIKKELSGALGRWDPTYRSAFWRGMLIRNPIAIAAFTVLFASPRNYLRYGAYSLFIATLVNLFCILAVQAATGVLAALAHWRGRPAPVRMPSWYWAISVVAMVPSLYAAFGISGIVYRWLGLGWEPPSALDYRISLLFGAIFVLLFYLSKARGEARERVQQLENQHLQAKLAALTAQMNPHLFFNALNTVAAFIATDPRRAEATLVTLGDLYRGVLRASARERHSLRDELALCQSYLELEKARFGDRLRSDFVIPSDLPAERCEIPVMTLQPLVENAVKHGIAPRAAGGVVAVAVRREGETLVLQVTDDGPGFGRSPVQGNGRALGNCRERLRLGFGEQASLEIADGAPGGVVRVRLPLAECLKEEAPCVF